MSDRSETPGTREKGADRQSSGIPATGPAMIVEDLSTYYGSFKALADINVQIGRNRIVALIGPSGCGKSTFVRCLNRMHEVARGGWVKGRVLLDGEDIYAENVDPVRVRRKVGMVFQKP
jgi:phosphate transport system ATP-binding protein